MVPGLVLAVVSSLVLVLEQLTLQYPTVPAPSLQQYLPLGSMSWLEVSD